MNDNGQVSTQSMQVLLVSKQDLEAIVSIQVSKRLDVMEEKILGGDELGRVGGMDLAIEVTGYSEVTIRHMIAERFTENGIPCIERKKGKGGKWLFSSVALKRWMGGASSVSLIQWMTTIIEGN